QEARTMGFDPQAVAGGVTVAGDWRDVWRCNIGLRTAGRVLVRLVSFRAFHLAQLDKRARKLPWGEWLPAGAQLTLETTTQKSKIYHGGAASQRILGAARMALGPESPEAPALRLLARIDDNLVTVSVDTSGDPLHRRGHKAAVGKAPLRETMAAAFLMRMGFDGSHSVIDPMCGSGTFVLEAAEIAAGLPPGRSRAFAFETLPSAQTPTAKVAIAALRSGPQSDARPAPRVRFFGQDRDDGAIRNATANADRAGVSDWVRFTRQAISATTRPDGPPGLIMVNPPYGARIGNRKLLFGLYGSLGEVLRRDFGGWRVGLVTSDAGLARATGLPWLAQDAAVSHGSLKVRLYRTAVL
ncbi:MAG: THUMP domain-containing class I SAM-dependent RNA methyltransferase, partial [Primorskyibacter sp.]